MHYADTLSQWFQATLNASWSWFNRLNHQEWLVLLALTAVSGLLCMRGFGVNKN